MSASRQLAAMGMSLLCAVTLAGCNAVPLSSLGIQTTSVEDALAQQKAAQAAEAPAGLKQAGTLTVGVRSYEAAPLLIATDGGLKGLDVEIGAALADQMGCEVAFVYADSVNDALTSSCDVVMGVSDQEATNASVLGSYANSAIALFHKGEAGPLAADQLVGKTIAVQEGSASQQILRNSGIALVEVPTSSLNEAFEDLEHGEVDFVVCPAASGFYLSMGYGDIACAGTLNDPLSLGVALSAEESEATAAVREAYASLEANGVLSEARRRWLGDASSLTPEWRISSTVATA